MAGLHHVEIWISDPESVRRDWGWLLERLGFARTAQWREGTSWEAEGVYLTFTTSPSLSGEPHDRRRSGLNHLAFSVDDAEDADAIMAEAIDHGWHPLYHERYPHAGGAASYAGWLENAEGFKAEIVAQNWRSA